MCDSQCFIYLNFYRTSRTKSERETYELGQKTLDTYFEKGMIKKRGEKVHPDQGWSGQTERGQMF